MGDDEQDAMQALLGFSAFGGSSRAPKKRAAGASSPHSATAQLMPGTELAWSRDGLPEKCRAGSAGALLLISQGSEAVAALKAAFASHAAVDDDAEDLLPQASQELLAQVQEQRQRCVQCMQFLVARVIDWL